MYGLPLSQSHQRIRSLFQSVYSKLLSLLQIYFRNLFCYRAETNCNFKYVIRGLLGPLKNLTFLVSLGIAEIQKTFEFFIYIQVRFSSQNLSGTV